MNRKILVLDSHDEGSKKINAFLQNLWEDDVVFALFEPNTAQSLPSILGAQLKGDENIDLFFFSANSILQSQDSLDLVEIKKKHGSQSAKIVAMSVLPSYLTKVAKVQGVDYVHVKKMLIKKRLHPKLRDYEHKLLWEYYHGL